MFQQMKKRIKNEKGLTLVELLAVVVILGIIAAIAIPAIGNIIDNSRIKGMKSDAVNIINAASLYYNDGNTVTFDETTSDEYVGDPGRFEEYEVTPELLFTGEAEIGNATVKITGASIKEIEVSSATGDGTKVITSKDTED